MVSSHRLYIERSENELKLAEIIFAISSDTELQKTTFNIDAPESFYSAVITHAYYSIFYAAKSYLMAKNITTEAPEEHRKTYEEFRKLVESGELDFELLKIYEYMAVRAESLLGIIRTEKNKRGKFTYQRMPQANIEPAKESIDHARTFFKHIYRLCESRN